MKLTLITLILSPLAAVAIERPLHWTADIARVTPMQFDAMHGDALAFNVDFNASGKPVDLTGLDATLYWQTNGMESAWWSATGIVSNSTARALFPTAADPGSKTLNFFLGLADGSNVVYGASARVTFRNSPGATPNTIAPPVVTLDFATIDVLHAPWATPDDVAAAVDTKADRVKLADDERLEVSSWVVECIQDGHVSATTNMVFAGFNGPDPFWAINTNNYFEGFLQYMTEDSPRGYVLSALGAMMLPIGGSLDSYYIEATSGSTTWRLRRIVPQREIDVAYVDDVAAAVAPLCTIEAAEAMRAAESNRVDALLGDYLPRTTSAITGAGVTTDYLINSAFAGGIRIRYSSSNLNNYTSYGYRGVTARRNGVGEDWLWDTTDANGIVRRKELAGITTEEIDPTVPSWAKAATKPGYTAAEVGAATTEDVYRLVSGTNVIIVITNYNSAVHAPSMKLQRLDPETGEYVTYWDETRRHGLTLTNAMDYTDRATNELARTKADRAWGKYTSAYGVDAPAGVTWLSEEQTVFAAGHDFAKTVTSGGEIFTLVSTGLMLANVECPTNAAFWQITANGETLYRIEKTSSRVVDVSVNAVSVANPYLLVDLTGWMYPDHPLVRVRPDLTEGDWLNEEDYAGGVIPGVAAVTWLGTGAAGDPYICQIENLSGGDRLFAGFWYEAPGETKIIPNGVTDVSGGKWYNGQKYVPTVSGNELKFIRQQ